MGNHRHRHREPDPGDHQQQQSQRDPRSGDETDRDDGDHPTQRKATCGASRDSLAIDLRCDHPGGCQADEGRGEGLEKDPDQDRFDKWGRHLQELLGGHVLQRLWIVEAETEELIGPGHLKRHEGECSEKDVGAQRRRNQASPDLGQHADAGGEDIARAAW